MIKKSAVSKIPDVSSLATKSALTVVENKILDVSSLVKKTEYNKLVTKVDNTILQILLKELIMLQKLLQLKMTMSLMQHWMLDIKI